MADLNSSDLNSQADGTPWGLAAELVKGGRFLLFLGHFLLGAQS